MKKTRSRSTNCKHHKSVDSAMVLEVPFEVSHGIPKMNNTQTKRLLTRLMDGSQVRQDFGRESDRKLSDLKSRNERMQVTVDLLQLMHGSDLSVRCLQHNNTLSLYCLTEHKILCVNCTYGDTKHRTHKVLPLRDSMHSIRKDNQQLQLLLKNDLKMLEVSIKNEHGNVFVLTNTMESQLRRMQGEYVRAQAVLQSQYEKAVGRVKERFVGVINKANVVKRRVEEFKGRIEEYLSFIGIGIGTGISTGSARQSPTKTTTTSTTTTSRNGELSKQICASIFAELSKFQYAPISQRQLQSLLHPVEF